MYTHVDLLWSSLAKNGSPKMGQIMHFYIFYKIQEQISSWNSWNILFDTAADDDDTQRVLNS